FVSGPRHNADDRQRWIFFGIVIRGAAALVVVEVKAERILTGKISLRKSLIDNDRTGTIFIRPVLGTKGASPQDWHFHHLEVIGRNDVDFRGWLLSRLRFARAGNVKRAVPFAVVKRNIPADRGCLDAGPDAHPIEQAIPERSELIVVPNLLPVLVIFLFL